MLVVVGNVAALDGIGEGAIGIMPGLENASLFRNSLAHRVLIHRQPKFDLLVQIKITFVSFRTAGLTPIAGTSPNSESSHYEVGLRSLNGGKCNPPTPRSILHRDLDSIGAVVYLPAGGSSRARYTGISLTICSPAAVFCRTCLTVSEATHEMQ